MFQKNVHHWILFADENIVYIAEKFNRQNDHVYAKTGYEAKDKISRLQRGHHPQGISYSGTA